MKEHFIDKNKIIVREPIIFVDDVYCKTKKEQYFYKIFNSVSIVCGCIGIFGFIMMLSYYYL